jgi:hypothetical protein
MASVQPKGRQRQLLARKREAIVRIAAISAFAACVAAFALNSTAQSATGMSAMQYYVGSWSCTGGAPGKTQSRASITYTLDNGVLRGWVAVPAQTGMKTPYNQEAVMTYDAKNHRYVQVSMDSQGFWTVSYIMLNGNRESGTDHAVSSGHPGHSTTDRVSNSTFTFLGYPTLTSTKPDFGGTCHRS